MTDGSYKKKKFEHRLVQRKDHMKIGRSQSFTSQGERTQKPVPNIPCHLPGELALRILTIQAFKKY